MQLTQARLRLKDQVKLLNDAQENLDFAVKQKLASYEADLRAKIKRYKSAVEATKGLISDLEKASGALPLDDKYNMDAEGRQNAEAKRMK